MALSLLPLPGKVGTQGRAHTPPFLYTTIMEFYTNFDFPRHVLVYVSNSISSSFQKLRHM